MKKIILLSLLAVGIMYAAEAEEKGVDRVKVMQKLENGMSTIQKGLMYNNRNIIQKGVDEVKKNTSDINAFDIQNEKGKKFKAKKYAETESKAISQLADDLIEGYAKGDKNRVLDTFRKMQNQCMTCHRMIRKW